MIREIKNTSLKQAKMPFSTNFFNNYCSNPSIIAYNSILDVINDLSLINLIDLFLAY